MVEASMWWLRRSYGTGGGVENCDLLSENNARTGGMAGRPILMKNAAAFMRWNRARSKKPSVAGVRRF